MIWPILFILPLRIVREPAPRPPLFQRELFKAIHESLMDDIQAGRVDDAADRARQLAYVGPRL